MLGAAESAYSFLIFTSSRQYVEQRLCLCSDRRYRTPRGTKPYRRERCVLMMANEFRPYEAERLAVLVVNGSAANRISSRHASLRRKIAPNTLEIWKCPSTLCRAPRRELGALSPRRGPTLAAIVLCHAVKRHPSRRSQTGGSHEIVTSSPRRCRRARAQRADPDPIGTRPIG